MGELGIGELLFGDSDSEGATARVLLPVGLSLDEWKDAGEKLGRIGKAYQWWIGDWLNYGERQYGDGTYERAEQITGKDYGTLQNLSWVSNAVGFSFRNENLSHTHHVQVAALPPAKQTQWLKKAAAENWSVRDLRRAIKAPPSLPAPTPVPGVYSTLVIDPPWPMEKIEYAYTCTLATEA